MFWDGSQTLNTHITFTSQEFQLLSMLFLNLKHLMETKRWDRKICPLAIGLPPFFFFLIHVFRHLYNLTCQSLSVLRNEHCLLHSWDADCELSMQYAAFTLWLLCLSFPQANTCDVKNSDKDLLAMPAASLKCKANGRTFVNCCNYFGKDKSHVFAELTFLH